MTERQRVDEDELRGGRLDDLAAEAPTAPAVGMPTSAEDQTHLPPDPSGMGSSTGLIVMPSPAQAAARQTWSSLANLTNVG